MWNQKPYVDSQIRNFDYIAAHLTPDAAAADSGKVLTVGSDGKSEWAEGGSGGASGLLVTVTVDGDTRTLDKTYEEIVAAINNGVAPIIVTTDSDGAGYIDYVNMFYIDPDNGDTIETMNSYVYVSDPEDGVLTWQNPGGDDDDILI